MWRSLECFIPLIVTLSQITYRRVKATSDRNKSSLLHDAQRKARNDHSVRTYFTLRLVIAEENACTSPFLGAHKTNHRPPSHKPHFYSELRCPREKRPPLIGHD
ncbi:hypothetical protein RRG08_016028 [Elysia crispata]|uniref:Uncharacterized protein n=1 Tax=Elysia crispata TaxID=231223 RepID=A0AAE1B4T8_9GAST|nr:hypothetical protein RRG08_016028 [Elysia crispata]